MCQDSKNINIKIVPGGDVTIKLPETMIIIHADNSREEISFAKKVNDVLPKNPGKTFINVLNQKKYTREMP